MPYKELATSSPKQQQLPHGFGTRLWLPTPLYWWQQQWADWWLEWLLLRTHLTVVRKFKREQPGQWRHTIELPKPPRMYWIRSRPSGTLCPKPRRSGARREIENLKANHATSEQIAEAQLKTANKLREIEVSAARQRQMAAMDEFDSLKKVIAAKEEELNTWSGSSAKYKEAKKGTRRFERPIPRTVPDSRE